ncbi:MAG: nitroreductase family protein [Acidimicrobiales bacterium]
MIAPMELAEVMTTAFSCREFTDDPVSDADIEAMVALARFAPSGGNRQPWRVVAVRDGATKTALRRAAEPAMQLYLAQVAAGEAPWNTIVPTSVDVEERWNADDPVAFLASLEAAPVLLCVRPGSLSTRSVWAVARSRRSRRSRRPSDRQCFFAALETAR